MEFLTWVEQLAFSTWVRESPSLLGYAFILTLHTIGLGIVVGISIVLDVRMLGFAQGVTIAPLERFFPILWIGFWLNALSGVILLMADATTKMTNYMFYIKMALLALAVWNTLIIRKRVFHGGGDSERLPPNAKQLAWMSIGLWIAATTAGRLMAYTGPVSGLK